MTNSCPVLAYYHLNITQLPRWQSYVTKWMCVRQLNVQQLDMSCVLCNVGNMSGLEIIISSYRLCLKKYLLYSGK
jgi:hypothetical protein